MAAIDDPRLVKWSNERARTMADQLTALYYKMLAYKQNWALCGFSQMIAAAGPSEVIADGSPADGRQPITGQHLLNLALAIDTLLENVEGELDGLGISTVVVAGIVQVNGSPR